MNLLLTILSGCMIGLCIYLGFNSEAPANYVWFGQAPIWAFTCLMRLKMFMQE